MLGAAPTLESNYWFGAQGNRLWVGQVECDGDKTITGDECVDYQESNRVKVRIMGYHTRSRSQLKSLDLPWATVLMPTTETISRHSAGVVHGLENGMWVLGTFMDGESAQQPLVMGSIGIVDKRQQTYTDRVSDKGLSNDHAATHPEKVKNNKASSGGHGQSNRGENTGTFSANDKEQESNERQTFTVSNGKCGPRPEGDFAKILNDLFQFTGKNEKIGGVFVNKLTGNIVETAGIIQTYVSRLAAAASGILGDIKQLILSEFKKYFQQFIITPITTALALKPTKDSEIIWGANKLGDVFIEIFKCIFGTILEELLNLILDIVTGIIDDAVNSAFCMVQDIISGITSKISDLVGSALGALSNVTSLISQYGDWGGSWLSKIGELVALFCDGQLSCILGIGEYTTKEGESSDNSVGSFMNRIETFGNLPNDAKIGLFGSDSFLSTFENTQIIDSDGNVSKGTLNCSKSNKFTFPAIPELVFTGLKYKFDAAVGDFPGPFPGTYSKGSKYPRAIPVINSKGKIIGAKITNPGVDISPGVKISVKPYRDWGSGAELKPIIKNGKIEDLIVINGGGGYPYFDGSNLNPRIPLIGNQDGTGSGTNGTGDSTNGTGSGTNNGTGSGTNNGTGDSTNNGTGSGNNGTGDSTNNGTGSGTNGTGDSTNNGTGEPDYDRIYGIYAENPYWIGIITPNNPPQVLNAGENLDGTCGIIVEPGKDEGTNVVLPELEPVIVNGRLISIKVIKEGFGFTSPPKMYMACTNSNIDSSDQRRVKIQPVLRYIPRKDAKDYLNLFDDYRDIIDCVGFPGDY